MKNKLACFKVESYSLHGWHLADLANMDPLIRWIDRKTRPWFFFLTRSIIAKKYLNGLGGVRRIYKIPSGKRLKIGEMPR